MNIYEVHSWKNNKILRKKLDKILKQEKEYGWNYPKRIGKNQRLIFLLSDENDILSVCHITFLEENTLQFSFCYTPILKRRRGYNQFLREQIINYFKNNANIHTFTSIPLPGSKSVHLLEKMGFIKQDNKYLLNI
jgi:hypothetical protein